jgi:peptidyl-prolyl isomerase F (cyclophilin D)
MRQGNPIVYLDIKLGRYGEGTPLGRVVIELKARCAAATAASRRCARSAPRRAAALRCTVALRRLRAVPP